MRPDPIRLSSLVGYGREREPLLENTRRLLAVLLESFEEGASIRRAVSAFRRYQVAGVAAFARGLVAEK